MKPLDPKDRPKIIALMVLSVLMIGFFLKTLMGAAAAKNDNNPPSANPVPPAPAPVAAGTSAPGDPAALAPNPNGARVDLSLLEISGPEKPFRRVLPDLAKLNNMMSVKPPKMGLPSIGGQLPRGPLSVGMPNGSGISLQPIGPATTPEPAIRLDGVVSDRAHYAMVTVRGRTEMYRAGSTIAGTFKLLSIDEFGASFQGPQGEFRLEVGQERNPNAPSAPSPAPTGRTLGRQELVRGGPSDKSMLPVPSEIALATER